MTSLIILVIVVGHMGFADDCRSSIWLHNVSSDLGRSRFVSLIKRWNDFSNNGEEQSRSLPALCMDGDFIGSGLLKSSGIETTGSRFRNGGVIF